MPKVKETDSAFVITPSFGDQLAEALSAILPSILKVTQMNLQEKSERRKTELELEREQRKRQAEFTSLDPHAQQEILRTNPDFVTDLYDPNFARRQALGSSSLPLRGKDKAEFESLRRQRVNESGIKVREHTPEEAENERKARFAAAEAETKAQREAFQFQGQRDFEKTFSDFHAGKGSAIDVLTKHFQATGSFPKTQDELANLLQPESQLNISSKAEPGSPMWAAENASVVTRDLFKNYPGVDPKQIYAYALRGFDKNAPEAKLPKGLEERRLDLDKAINDRLWASHNLDASKFKLEQLKLYTDLSQRFANNLPDKEKPNAARYAETWLRTGSLPPGALFPADAKESLEKDRITYEIEKAKLDIAKAKVEDPQFSRILQMVEKAPADSDEKTMWFKKAEARFFELYPSTGERPQGFFQRAWEKYKNFAMGLQQMNETVLKLGVDAGRGLGESIVASERAHAASHGQPSMIDAAKSAIESVTGPIDSALSGTQTLSPEQQKLVDKHAETMLQLVQNPQTPEAVKQTIRAQAEALKKAKASGNVVEVMRIITGGK